MWGTEVDKKVGIFSQEQVKIHFKYNFLSVDGFQALPMLPKVRKDVKDNKNREKVVSSEADITMVENFHKLFFLSSSLKAFSNLRHLSIGSCICISARNTQRQDLQTVRGQTNLIWNLFSHFQRVFSEISLRARHWAVKWENACIVLKLLIFQWVSENWASQQKSN